ncbi:uncharacterized protein B0I36DRAFT_351948 [Microdochium trichocladiopsis]|uniref:Uncharacterized protein n=1 Tax=Microdochium trichocladiopsis TaxID=1682393 RepID=A0A9P8Y2J7_9PEZI|nr:uncharacterized protein B0I36DRAFT_351948 [Microdochium trichocladiopsis]KAH7026017.1 hypothetical protein B0I36DRAFT_351948 [Microdochium trichocladiopsis]
MPAWLPDCVPPDTSRAVHKGSQSSQTQHGLHQLHFPKHRTRPIRTIRSLHMHAPCAMRHAPTCLPACLQVGTSPRPRRRTLPAATHSRAALLQEWLPTATKSEKGWRRKRMHALSSHLYARGSDLVMLVLVADLGPCDRRRRLVSSPTSAAAARLAKAKYRKQTYAHAASNATNQD